MVINGRECLVVKKMCSYVSLIMYGRGSNDGPSEVMMRS